MKRLVIFILLSVLIKGINAQGIYNDGARIVSASGSYWVIDNDDFTLTSESSSQIAQMDNVVITDDASLTLTDATCLNVSGDITVNSGGNITLNSGSASTASLIGLGTASGTAIAQRYMTGNAWHMVSSPSPGEFISDFLSVNSNVPSNGSARGMMDYNESSNDWNTFFANDHEGNLTLGKGFSLRTDADGTVTFAGALATGTVNATVSRTGDNGWNCVGNPYPSVIFINDAADATNNFLSLNTGNLDGSYAVVYVWEQDNGAYTIISKGDEAFYAQAGQAFFIKAATDATQVQFTTAMQTHQPAADFKSGTITSPEIRLTATMDEKERTARIKFNDAMTTGLDVGYDAGVFKTGFDIYTKLIEDNGVDFGLQSLQETGIEGYEIPVGIDVATGGKIAFSLKSENLLSGIIPVLNDKQTGTSFSFGNENDVYTTSISDAMKGYGRFTLTFSSTTGIEGNAMSSFKAWYSDGYIYISGQMDGAGEATVYDINGRKIAIRQLTHSNQNRIEAPVDANGIYLVRINDSKRSEVLKVPVAGR